MPVACIKLVVDDWDGMPLWHY